MITDEDTVTIGGKRVCTSRNPHADGILSSCGNVVHLQYHHDYRCDLQPGHVGPHHACGTSWQVNWQ